MRSEPALQSSEHLLQLFDSPQSLAQSVSRFIAGGLGRGDNAIIAATPTHTKLIGRKLNELGWNLHDAIAANRLVAVDAEQTLAKFMRGDRPNPAAFDELIGTLVQRLAAGRRLWIYGEMVDVLAGRGNFKGAQLLEDLWTGLAVRECFTLFCGYSSAHFGNLRNAAALGAICATHDHVRRNSDDVLAEFLLEHPDVKSAAGVEPDPPTASEG
jgi:hypothetical protein